MICTIYKQGSDGFNGKKFDEPVDVSRAVKNEQAFQALQRLCRESKGTVKAIIKMYTDNITIPFLNLQDEVTVVAIGPLTNLALAFKTDKEFAKNLHRLVIMGGNMSGEGNNSLGAEFNFMADADAAFVVIDSVQCPCLIATWELCVNEDSISEVTGILLLAR